jgi:glycosidase
MTAMRWLPAKAFLLVALHQSAFAGERLSLHVPSPDWRDQVIYLAMIDRFDDGDPANNDQHAGEYDPADPARFSGGDLAGAARRVAYLERLGVTALWLTPPVANQWWDPKVGYGGYHGYWASDFKSIDRHFGTLQDYRRLSDALHRRGMYLVHDVVVNHVGNYVQCSAPGRCTRSGAPAQAPFSSNDPADARHAYYHWNPRIADFDDKAQRYTWQLADLDDLDTEDPVVRRALRDSHGYWIREAGVDAFRVDTAFYVPPDYFTDFLHAADPQAPGILAVARATGRDDFHVFGEGFGLDKPFEDEKAKQIDEYMRGDDRLPGMINFPLHGSLLDVFARGRPPSVLAHRVRSMMALHARPHRMPTFVDNHDVERFLAGGSDAALKQALLAILTLPGIPTIYYGTEQGFTEQRGAMFAGGFGSGGRDRFDTAAPLYGFLQRAIALRRGHRVFSRGVPAVFTANPAAPGAFGYTMTHDGEAAVVLFNTSDRETLVARAPTGLPAGRLQPVFTIDGAAKPAQIDRDGTLTLRLPPRSGQAWLATGGPVAAAARGTAPTIDPVAEVVHDSLPLSGRAARAVELVVDGDLGRAMRAQARRGAWKAQLETADFIDPAVVHTLVARDVETGAVSAPRSFRVERDWREAASVVDPAGDDRGRSGRLRYPEDASWAGKRPLDLRGARAWTSGGSLRVEVALADLLSTWNAPNGFEHVLLTVFVELPGAAPGATVMPQQDGTLPAGHAWHFRLRLGGWSNALFSARGASATNEGTPVTPSAGLRADLRARTLAFTLPASALGTPRGLRGARVHVTTWDYDGGYRALAAEPAGFDFGGGRPGDARVMDELTLVLE